MTVDSRRPGPNEMAGIFASIGLMRPFGIENRTSGRRRLDRRVREPTRGGGGETTRVLALAMVVLAPVMIVAIAIIYVASRGLPKDASTALQSYLTHRYDRASMPLIREENLATRPWLFTSEVSGPTFVEGAFYQTTVNFGNLSTGEANWPSTPVAGQGYYSNLNSLRALPYPPEQIWCALTDSKDQGEVPLLVAAHMDMYNAQWIVHEMPAAWTADRVNALLTDLGCAIDWHPSR